MPNVIFADSFGHYATADLTKKYSSAVNATISASVGRNGTAALDLVGASTASSVSIATGAHSALYVEMALKTPSAINQTASSTAIIRLLDGSTTQVDLRLLSTGELQVTRNGTELGVTSGLGLLTSTYYHIGFYALIHPSAGAYDVRLNGVSVLSGSAANTRATANSSVGTVVAAGCATTVAVHSYIDELVVSTDGFCGDSRVKYDAPNGAGNYSAWTPSAGANYQNVDEAALNSDTDYNSTLTAGAVDSYAFPALGITGNVKAVQFDYCLRKDDAGTRLVRFGIRAGGVDYWKGSTYSVADSYVIVPVAWPLHPANNQPWAVADAEAAQPLIKLES